jgi:ATP-dependent DNA helicase RecQ
VIFSDRTLIEMATYYPQTTASLAKINGVGQIKLERYGKIFLEILCTYCTARGIPEKSPQNGTPAPVAKMLVSRPRYVEVGEAYNAGQSLEALMAQYQVQQVTILDHLAKYAQEGNPLRNGGDFLALSRLPVHVQQAALQAFEVQGSGYLKPVYEQLNGAVDYDELRLLRLHFLSTREPRS